MESLSTFLWCLEKDTIDPKANRLNKVYSGAAWTPEYPSIDYVANSEVEDILVDDLRIHKQMRLSEHPTKVWRDHIFTFIHIFIIRVIMPI